MSWLTAAVETAPEPDEQLVATLPRLVFPAPLIDPALRGRPDIYEDTMDENEDRLLTPAEVAALFRVNPKTVVRWATAGQLDSVRTPGGHRRFHESAVRTLLEGGQR